MSNEVPFEVIPLTAITLGIVAGITSMVLKHRVKKALLEAYHRERVAAIECGMTEMPPMPPELVRILRGDAPRPADGMKAGVNLLIGLVLLLAGAVLALALSAVAGSDVGLFGLLPAAVGLANLLYFFIVRAQTQAAPPSTPDAP